MYSYIVYPYSLHFFDRKYERVAVESTHKSIHILIPAYNEELCLKACIHSILASSRISDYTIYIGDDGSTDNTCLIAEEFQRTQKNIQVERYHRIGKPAVLDAIIQKYALNNYGHFLVFIDANIQIGPQAIAALIDEFHSPEIGIVGASVLPSQQKENIESKYILRENIIKYHEAVTFGHTIGVFGACYAMQADMYESVPDRFITDDLYQTLATIAKGKKVLFSKKAFVYENIGMNIPDEFKRKRRFAAGNFQILWHFKHLLWPSYSSISFIYCYIFHKVIRWTTPIIMSILWLYSFFVNDSLIFNVVKLCGLGFFLYIIVNFVLLKSKLAPLWTRLFYFLSMNLALLTGFYDFLRGVKTNVWERSKRYQNKLQI